MTASTVTATLSLVMTSWGGTSTTCSRMSTLSMRWMKGTTNRRPGSTVVRYLPRFSMRPCSKGRTVRRPLAAMTRAASAMIARRITPGLMLSIIRSSEAGSPLGRFDRLRRRPRRSNRLPKRPRRLQPDLVTPARERRHGARNQAGATR